MRSNVVIWLLAAGTVQAQVSLSRVHGAVSILRGTIAEPVAAPLDAPLAAGDRIVTGPHSRADIRLDSASVLRMASNAEIRLTQWENGRYRMELAKGGVAYGVEGATTASVELVTPNVTVRPSLSGSYRISAGESGDSTITAQAGDIEVLAPSGSQWVRQGHRMSVRGSAADPQYNIAVPFGVRLARILSITMQVADIASDIGSSVGEARSKTPSSESNGGNSKPAAGASPHSVEKTTSGSTSSKSK